MRNSFLAFATLLLLGCNRTSETTRVATGKHPGNEELETIATEGEMCFWQVSGGQKQDTAWVRLNIADTKVTGAYWLLPYEKDSRRGTLNGLRKGDVVYATWTFMQEGQSDSLPVQFRITSNHLQLKPYSYNAATGLAFLADSAQFTLVYDKIDCALSMVLNRGGDAPCLRLLTAAAAGPLSR
ncbi:hypothetical protein [Pontibacter harenae]|uniref:hypothetical protein n=1 Tax=Pontibacter harenae TaxID=2894083 RepID=UPI001E33803F|nr:hypothetical protein [Pontibacter harenae]MCC9169194.1 hypothetical protein [Pontibacter harenae]